MRALAAAAGALGAAMLLAAPALASWRPDLVTEVGGTFAVNAEPDEGGFSLALASMWPVDPPFGLGGALRFGVMGFADDMGSQEIRLQDPNDPSIDLGPAEGAHRIAWGGAWRLDATAPVTWWGWSPVGNASWGVWRVQDDVRGEIRSAVSSTGFGLGLGLDRPLSSRHAIGIGVRYDRLFNDVVGRYMSGGLNWRWKLGN